MKTGKTRACCTILLSASMASAALGQNTPASAQNEVSGQPAGAGVAVQALPETPVSPPKVTCTGDQLSIAAKGSTLASILAAVRQCTGATIDVPEGFAQARFFDTLGPGPAREVLSSLLDDTNLNYVIRSSDADPEKVEAVVLTARGDTPESAATTDRALNTNRRAFLQMRRNYLVAGVPGDPSTPMRTDNEDPAPDVAPDSTPAADAPQTAPQPASDTSANQPAAAQPPAGGPDDTNTAPARNENTVSPAPAQNTAVPSSDVPQASSTSSPVDDQIKSMEQLFEQRRQMMANQQPKP